MTAITTQVHVVVVVALSRIFIGCIQFVRVRGFYINIVVLCIRHSRRRRTYCIVNIYNIIHVGIIWTQRYSTYDNTASALFVYYIIPGMYTYLYYIYQIPILCVYAFLLCVCALEGQSMDRTRCLVSIYILYYTCIMCMY